jgi:membrane-bound ClpP family serine protease
LETKSQQPIRITIVAILIIVGGILFLFAGMGTATIGVLFFHGIIGIIFAIIGAILLAVGIGYSVVSYGLSKRREWAWTATIILLFIGIGINVAYIVFRNLAINMDIVTFFSSNGGSFVGIAINVVILDYLNRIHVKSYFGKTANSTTKR